MHALIYETQPNSRLTQSCTEAGLAITRYSEVERGSFLDEQDCIVMDVTQPDMQTQFILAQAILFEKPVLGVYEKINKPHELFQQFGLDRPPKNICIKPFEEKSLTAIIEQYTQKLQNIKLSYVDIPSIKFTLRLTPKLDAYLQHLSEREGKKKADILREQLEMSMLRDGFYDDKQ